MAQPAYPTLRSTNGGPISFAQMDANLLLLNNLFIGDTPPVGQQGKPYVWIQTNVNGVTGDLAIWVEDGN